MVSKLDRYFCDASSRKAIALIKECRWDGWASSSLSDAFIRSQMKREVGRALWVTQEFITLLTLKVEGERGNARQQYQTRAMGPSRVVILSETLHILRCAIGRFAVVQPKPEPFPSIINQ